MPLLSKTPLKDWLRPNCVDGCHRTSWDNGGSQSYTSDHHVLPCPNAPMPEELA